MIFIVTIISLISIWPLFSSGFFSMHDFQQVARLFELDKTLMGGSFPVRWVADLGFGFGYPLFNFYPPLVYYFGEIFHLLGFGFINSIKIIWGIALIGSAVSMYFLSKEFFGKVGGAVCAAFYLYAPYHAVDAYVRGSLSELFSFVWLPLILLFSYKRKPVATGICLALLMITHNLIFLPFAGIYCLWVLLINGKNLHNSLFIIPNSLLVALGLTAFFWLPSLAEKQFTLVDQFLTTGLASYQIHFVCPDQLWNSLWGYGGSIAGCLDGVSFKLGKPQIILALLALLIALWKRSRLLLVSFGLFVFSVFMTTSYSQFIWDRVTLLWYLQFPWRFLEFAALFSAILSGSVFLVIKKPIWQWVVGIIMVVSVVFLHGKYFAPQIYDFKATDATLLSDDQIKWVVSQTSFEYLPKGMAVKPTPQGSYVLDVATYPTNKFLVISGDFTPTQSQFEADRFSLAGVSKNGAQIQFQIANFPGWKVWVDGKEVSINDNNKLKLITVSIPSGQHQIRGEFTNTPVRTVGNLISLSTFISLLCAIVIKLRGRSKISP